MRTISVAIDGPSGAGKSTLAKSVAAKLNYLYVDTGAIYRTIGYHVFIRSIDPKDEAAVSAQLPEIQVELTYGDDGLQHMLLNGQDITREIRLPEISMYASAVSAHPSVRAYLLEMQRQLARTSNVIMDGRDIGTVVLPDADLKIFLTAKAEDRAQRRYHELQQRGQQTDYETVLRDVIQRDRQDTEREIAPLRQADDAVLVDTTGSDLVGSREILRNLVQERFGL